MTLERRAGGGAIDTIGLELVELRIAYELQANVISRLADGLYMKPRERDTLLLLRELIEEVAGWAANLRSLSIPPAGLSGRSCPLD